MSIDIVILSYNRPGSLERLLKSLMSLDSNAITIHINDDNSPQKNELLEIFDFYKSKLRVPIFFHSRSSNVGYDANLMSSFSIGNGKYTFLMSNDDYFDINVVELFEQVLSSDFDIGMVSYKYLNEKYRGDSLERKNPNHSKLIYDSILFSGLIFKKESLLPLDEHIEFLKSCIYAQVFIVSQLFFLNRKLKYFTDNSLLLGNDGENFFGKNSSAGSQQSDLIDRDSVYSNLNYQKRLLKVVSYIDSHIHKGLYSRFQQEYFRRLVGYLFKLPVKDRKFFVSCLKEGGYNLSNKDLFIIKLLSFVPYRLSKSIYDIARELFRKSG